MNDESPLAPRPSREESTLPDLDRPDGYEPLLTNNFQDLASLHLAIGLLEHIAKGGGARVSTGHIASLRKRIADAVPNEIHGLLAEELVAICGWLDDRPSDEQSNPDVSFIRSNGARRWRAIVKYAVDAEFDLRGEYYDPESETWPVVFGTPLFFDEDSVVLERVDGVFITVLFRDTRWLMPVRQQRKPELATVLPFRTTEEE